MTTLTVIAGGMDTGKSLIAEALVAFRPGMVMVARDHVRAMMNTTDEAAVTGETWNIARIALREGRNVIAVGWNLLPSDREGWAAVAAETGAALRWVVVSVGA